MSALFPLVERAYTITSRTLSLTFPLVESQTNSITSLFAFAGSLLYVPVARDTSSS
jgi:hypothetical protein